MPMRSALRRISKEAAMKIYLETEKGRALCERDGLVTTTFTFRDVPFRNGLDSVSNILVAVCDECGDIVAIPPQSSLEIKTAREKAAVSVDLKTAIKSSKS